VSQTQVTLEDAGPCRKLMHVRATAEAVLPEYDKVVKEFAKVAKVPGFRAGKAPDEVVERHYEKRIIEESRDRLVPRIYREALEQESIVPVSIIDVSDVDLKKAEGLSFKVMIDVAPSFKMPKYKKIPLKRQAVDVPDEELESSYKRMLESFSKFEDITDRGIKEGDLAQIDYSGLSDGTPVGELAAECTGLGEGKDFWLLCGPKEFLPGFTAGLLGAVVGETREITVDFPDNYHVKAVEGKRAIYQVEVKGLRERVPPEMNEEFLKRFEVESEAALKEKMKGDLLEAKEGEEKVRLKGEIAKVLLDRTKFDLPQSIVQQEMDLTVRNMVRRIAGEGATREQIESQQEAIVSSATETSRDRVKFSYILSRIADEEGIEVEDSEVDARIESMAQRYGMSPAKFRSELENRNGVEGLKSDIRSEKALDFLLEHAKIKG